MSGAIRPQIVISDLYLALKNGANRSPLHTQNINRFQLEKKKGEGGREEEGRRTGKRGWDREEEKAKEEGGKWKEGEREENEIGWGQREKTERRMGKRKGRRGRREERRMKREGERRRGGRREKEERKGRESEGAIA